MCFSLVDAVVLKGGLAEAGGLQSGGSLWLARPVRPCVPRAAVRALRWRPSSLDLGLAWSKERLTCESFWLWSRRSANLGGGKYLIYNTLSYSSHTTLHIIREY